MGGRTLEDFRFVVVARSMAFGKNLKKCIETKKSRIFDENQ